MRKAREDQFDPNRPPWLHCTSRCVRRAFLCGDGYDHRKRFIEARLRQLASFFAVEVSAYAVMSNHLHVIARPRPDQAQELSAEAVAVAWLALRDLPTMARDGDVEEAGDECVSNSGEAGASSADRGTASADRGASSPSVLPVGPVTNDPTTDVGRQVRIAELAANAAFVACWRERLGSIGWFMKLLKEPVARLANKEDDCTGAFWEGRFSSIPLLDDAAVVAGMVYVDLNPIRAQVADRPETSKHTGVKTRIVARQARRAAAAQVQAGDAEAARTTLHAAGLSLRPGCTLTHLDPARDDQARSWLTPITAVFAGRRLSAEDYLTLVDHTGRQMHTGKKGVIPPHLAAILRRLDHDPQTWCETMARPRSLLGSALGTAASLAQEATRRAGRWVQARCALFRRICPPAVCG